jgi:hypothetical protein
MQQDTDNGLGLNLRGDHIKSLSGHHQPSHRCGPTPEHEEPQRVLYHIQSFTHLGNICVHKCNTSAGKRHPINSSQGINSLLSLSLFHVSLAKGK